MLPSNRRLGTDASEKARPGHGTLPPPEWTAPKAAERAPTSTTPKPLPRRGGPRAEEAWLRARVTEARAAGDAAASCGACKALARWLASRDRDLDEAAELATEALQYTQDVELRRELSAWLECLGEPARAAAVLKPIASLPDVEAADVAYVLVRVGILRARAGAAALAAAAFDVALWLDSTDPLPAEMMGALSAWQADAVPIATAVEAYVESARRRAALAQDDAELLDLWRAFAADPSSNSVARAVASALEQRARSQAADEVWRAHAQALGPKDPVGAVLVHAERRASAIRSHEPVRALVAALDEGIASEGGGAFDALVQELSARGGGEGEDVVARILASVAASAGESERRDRPATPLRSVRANEEGPDSGAATGVRESMKARRGRALASSLELLAASQSAPVRGALLAAASACHLASGNASAARRAAELATQTDPTSARCAAALADAVMAQPRDRGAVAALERAVGVIGPHVVWCFALAEAFDGFGESDAAVGWSQRGVALCPGDRRAIRLLLDRLARAGDPSRLRDALVSVLGQPQPTVWVAPQFAGGLSELARLDPNRAAVLARRALDVIGPKSAALREAILSVAERVSDDVFAVAILERSLSCKGVEGLDRRASLVRLVRLRVRLGDDEGVARVAARAASEGLRGPELDERVGPAPGRIASPDAQLWRLRADAEQLAAGDDVAGIAWAWRDLGAAMWDLADDRIGAVDFWRRAACLAPGGHAILTLDLVAFAGVDFAFDCIARMAEAQADDAISTTIVTEASGALLSVGQARFAFELAARGLARTPGSGGALDAAELAAQPAGQQVALSALYDLVASKALGRFGRRAAHYRGARLFERAAMHSLALKHAAQAFWAVPSEGSMLQSLARTAARAGDRLLAMRTVEQVAEREDRTETRAMWLLRAASIAGDDEHGLRLKLDVLLRAAETAPNLTAIVTLGGVARELLRSGPEERDGLERRLGHAARSSSPQLHGPDGSRIALAFAMMLLELFGDADGALASVERAFSCDPDLGEYDKLTPSASALARAHEVRGRIAAMLAVAANPNVSVGVSALRLFAAIAAASGDDALRARASVAAASRAPDDDALVIDADDALRLVESRPAPSPESTERIAADIPAARRAAALVSSGRLRAAAGAHGEAAALFERAIDLVDPSASADVERELRRALDAAGRGSEIEARALREAVSETGSPSGRADAWTQIAELRERCGNSAGAAEALLEACRLDPEPLVRWSSLERVSELAGDDDARIEALEGILERVGDEGRATVLKRLARAHERRGDLQTAERTWRRVLALDSEDERVDQAIQSLIVARGNYDELAEHLALRAARLSATPDNRELLRAVRLRRAAILEQRLGRTADACDELELLLREWPDSVVALRYLADLYDRQSDFVRSVPLWRRAAALEDNRMESDELELRAARAARAAGDPVAAHEHASRVLARRPSSDGMAAALPAQDPHLDEALALRIDAARALGADAELSDALAAMASKRANEGRKRADLLLESARAALRSGDLPRALDRARRAVEAARDRAAPQLLARGLEYRMRGAGAPDEARATIEELSRIGEPLGQDDAALRAFLLAESLDVVQGGGAGLRELEATRGAIGDHALVALGIAERLAAQGQYDSASDAYRAALAGPLLELRLPAAMALAGADVAIRAGRTGDAAHFLGVAERHEDARAAAAALRERLEALPLSVEPAADVRLYDLEAAVHRARTADERASARLALARGRLDFGDARGAEPLLWDALADGLTEAGDVLAPMIASSPDRAAELVRVRWQQVALEPGDVGRLESLRAAALADDDRVHARAVEHVLRAFDRGAGGLAPPPLAAQPEQPGILAVLSRPSMDAAGEALALLWEGAMQLFVRDTASYGITGVERVEPGPSSTVSRLYEAAVRVLDVPRVPLFVTRTAGTPVDSRVALLSPPSVILAGDVQHETAELRFELGRGLTAALPHNVLRQALPEVEGRAVIEALRTAFGPPMVGRQVDPRVARLSESFWQIIPASAQRRLQELLRSAELANYEVLVEAAVQSGRRVGMFLAGDFACAARIVMAESAGRAAAPSALGLATPSLDNLGELCSALPALADLLRLAVRSEYADARWHSFGSASPRRAASSGRFSLF
jgi:tetratricopeptide (TPR) repeat protein